MSQLSLMKVIQDKLGSCKIPLYIGWTLTYRCNQRCLYCQMWKTTKDELNTKEAFSIIDELASMGTAVICFSGGEVLLRDDIGKIIDFAHRKNVNNIDINSNGSLVKRRISEIRGVRSLCLSLDGPERIHDKLRGIGSYDNVLEAVRIAKKNNIQVYFRTVISKLNLEYIDDILDMARKFKVKTIFQPSTQFIYGTNLVNYLAPDPIAYRKAIDKLIIEKRGGNRYINSPLPILRYLRLWPRTKKIFCTSGKIMFGIKPDGVLYPCTWGRDIKTIEGRDCLKLGVGDALRTLPTSFCNSCANTSSLEFNYRISLLLQKFSLGEKLSFEIQNLCVNEE